MRTAKQEPLELSLEDRGVLAVEGPDGRSFLQGLISNDIEKVDDQRSIWAALLTPQGKFLHEFFVYCPQPDLLLLDCEADRLADLKKRLGLYKLRSKVALTDLSEERRVAAFFGPGALAALNLPEEAGRTSKKGSHLFAVDPRHSALGARAILSRSEGAAVLDGFGAALREDYDRLRISLGVPDGSRDLEIEKSILLENGFDELRGVDWNKGCYIGQELTARTKYRGLVKKRLLPVAFDGPPPPPGTQVTRNGKDAGSIRSTVGDAGLALLRLEHLSAPLQAGTASLRPVPPDWLELPKKN